METKIEFVILAVILCFSFSYGVKKNNEELLSYDYERKISIGIENIENIIFGSGNNSEFDAVKSELFRKFLSSLKTCQGSLDLAASKANVLLNLTLESGSNNEDINRDNFPELFATDNSNGNDILEDDFSSTFADLKKSESGERVPSYFGDLERVLNAFKHACLSLPKALPMIHERKSRNPQNIVKRFALSLNKWSERWFSSMEDKIDSFFFSCTRDERCMKILEKLFEYLMNLWKENGNIFGNETSEAFEEALNIVSDTNSHSFKSMNYLQKVAIGMGNPSYGFQEKSGSYDIALGVLNSQDESARHDSDDAIYQYGFLMNLLRYPSQGNIWLFTHGEVEIDTKELAGSVHQSFLSVALGSSIIEEGWKEIKRKSQVFKRIASALSPSILRVGGSAANFLSYDPKHRGLNHPKFKKMQTEEKNVLNDNYMNSITLRHPKRKNQYVIDSHMFKGGDEEMICEPQLQYGKDFHNFTMTGNDWKFLVSTVHELKWELLFDLNQFWRDGNGHWDPTNAELLLNDPVSSKIPIIWQLGNEPNAYHHKFNWTLSPEEAAKDYKTLSAEVRRLEQKLKTSASIVGPDVTRPKHLEMEQMLHEDSMEFLERFLESSGKEDIDVLTFHQYYMNGRTADIKDFISPKILNLFPKQLRQVVSIRDKLAPSKEIWITETASAWGGGAPELSSRFVGGFPWLDKLGAAALGGANLVFRQTLYGGCYALLDHHLRPNPDFWVSVLHKRIVGTKVLLPRTRQIPPSLRIYAHCLNSNHHMYKKGAIVIFGMNLSNQPIKIKIHGELNDSSKFLYKLSSPKGNLKSRNILLNGELLKLDEDGGLPNLTPVKDVRKGLHSAPQTMNFWVFIDANATACI